MGRLIVFEGIDGCGKSTQLELACRRLRDEKADFARVSFPRYDEPSSALIKMYLAGEFGDKPGDVNAYAASSFFAVDRYASYKTRWRGFYEGGGTVLTDRYTTSNAIHQGAKLTGRERLEYFKWLGDYEFGLLGLPSPYLVLFMDIPPNEAARRIKTRAASTGARADIHESDGEYLRLCAECAREAAAHFGWREIPCLSGDTPRGELDIHEEIYALISG